jgi:hypothetical protein
VNEYARRWTANLPFGDGAHWAPEQILRVPLDNAGSYLGKHGLQEPTMISVETQGLGMVTVAKIVAESIVVGALGFVSTLAAGIILSALVGDCPYLDYFIISPTFLLPAICGITFARLRKKADSVSSWIWLPSVVLTGCFFVSLRNTRGSSWTYAASNFFGTNCGSTSCLYEFFVIPSAVTLAYSATVTLIRYKRGRLRPNDRPEMEPADSS